MPGTIPTVGDFIQVRANCRAASQLSQNVLHYRVTLVVAGGLSCQQLADRIFSTWDGVYRPWMPITAQWNSVSVQNITPPKTNTFNSTAAALAGTAIGDLVPRQASGLIGTRTELGGRANHGRVYVGFITSSHINADGELTGVGTAALQNIADQLGPTPTFTVGGVSTSLRLVVRHPDAGAPLTPQGTDVIGLGARSAVATQRRRGDFGRPNF